MCSLFNQKVRLLGLENFRIELWYNLIVMYFLAVRKKNPVDFGR